MEQIKDAPEVLETPAEVTPEPQEVTPEPEKEIDTEKEELRAKAEDLEKKNKQLFERLKKQETPKAEPEPALSNKDVLMLAKADVHSDDVDEIVEYAAFKKISISEALNSQVMRTLLSDRAEERKTAAATTTKGGGRGTAKVTGEDLLAKAERTGEVPDDTEGMQALFLARLARKFPSRK